MSDVNVRLKLSEDASSKLKKIASAGREATKQLSNTGKALDNAFKSSSLDSFSSNIGKAMSAAEDDVESLGDAIDDALKSSGKTVRLGVEVSDAAASTLGAIEDRADALDGTSVDVEVGADDSATQVVNAVEDSVSALDGASASAEIGAEDNASQVIDAASDKVSGFDGQEGSAEVGAEDNASPVLDDVKDKAEAWDGSVWEATVSIVDGVTSPLSAIARTVRNPLVAAGSMLGVGIGVSDTVDTYANFEATMSRVQALSNATSGELTQLTEKAKEMGAVTKYSGTESAEAFTYMAQAGWDVQSMIDGIGGIMSLAASDGIALADATDIVANALTSFGLTASDTARFADVLAVASSATNTDVAQLGEAFKYVAPVAGSLGYTIEDVSTALGLMSNNGIKGSMAGTSLKTSLANLAAPTDKMQSVMDKYNISLTDNEGNMKSLGEVMDNLRTSLGGLDEAEQTAAASMLFGKEAMAGMLSIINTSEEGYESLASQIENSTGAADRMAETMQDNLAGTLEQLGGQMETLQLSWGERLAPYVAGIADSISGILPDIQEAGLKVFDFLDVKIDNFQSRVSTMVNSDEWENADLFGKVNIAWNEIIAEPFMEWIGGDGKNLITKGLGTLFSEAGKILPGGEKAGLTSWLSAGILAKGSTSLISKAGSLAKTLSPIGGAIKGIGTAAKEATSIKGFISNLGSMVPAAGKFGIAAAAVTAAVVAIATAINNYNQMQIENSLEEHFGDIELSAEQLERAAGRILNAKYLVNIEAALNEFENADELAEQAEAALAENDSLEWMASIGVTWNEEDVSEYVSNIDTFIQSSMEELESRTYAATITVETMLGNTQEGQTLVAQMEQWAAADELEMQNLSDQLSAAVEKAMVDGVLDANEQAAITILQSKMNTILNSWKEADSEAAMDVLSQKYGSLSGKDLTSDTFTEMIAELGEQREEALQAVDEASEEVYSTINGLMNSGRLSESEAEMYKSMVAEAARNMEASALKNSVDFERNTLSDTYGKLLDDNYKTMEADAQSFIDSARNLFEMDDIVGAFNQLDYGGTVAQIYSGLFSSSDQKALASIYEEMKPDVDAISSIIDEYRNVGQAIPQELMTSFNEAMQLGAAAGDADAAWQVFANQMVADPANDALVKAIQDGTQSAPQELKDALDIALAETTSEPVTLEGLTVALAGMDLDVSQIAELTGMTEAEVQAYLEQYGMEVETTADVDVTTKAGEVDSSGAVQAGEEAEAAAQAVAGKDTEVDKTVTQNTTVVPGTTDTSQVENAANTELSSKTANQEVVTNTTYVPGTTDTSQVENAAAQELSSGAATQEIVTNLVYVPGNIDTSQVTGATQSALGQQTIESTATANVTSQMGTDNFSSTTSSFSSRFQSALASAFNKTFTATTNASITVNYSIANPSKTITFSGGGSGTATVYAHASGGIFEEPHYGLVAEAGPEAIIPLDGSDNAMGLWTQAGERLGLMGDDAPIASTPDMPLKADTGAGGDSKSTSKEINININGSGNLRVSGGMTKEDVVAILMEKARDVIEGIVEEDILVEGDGAYEY